MAGEGLVEEETRGGWNRPVLELGGVHVEDAAPRAIEGRWDVLAEGRGLAVRLDEAHLEVRLRQTAEQRREAGFHRGLEGLVLTEQLGLGMRRARRGVSPAWGGFSR